MKLKKIVFQTFFHSGPRVKSEMLVRCPDSTWTALENGAWKKPYFHPPPRGTLSRPPVPNHPAPGCDLLSSKKMQLMELNAGLSTTRRKLMQRKCKKKLPRKHTILLEKIWKNFHLWEFFFKMQHYVVCTGAHFGRSFALLSTRKT